MQFAAGAWLFGLLALPLLWLALRAADRRAERRGRSLLGDLAAAHRENWNPRVRSWRRFLFALGLFWLLLALARPQWGASEVTVRQRGRDVVVALDVSNSMLAQDEPPSRLARAKAELGDFVARMQHGRVGLVLFAGAAFVQCPLTSDYATADIFLRMAEPDMISLQGTAVAAALEVSRDVLLSGRPADGGDDDFQAILLVTDGEDLEGGWQEQVERCRRDGIVVIPVGVGTAEGGLVPRFDEHGRPDGFLRDPQGNVVMSRHDAATLARLGELGGAQAFRIGIDGLAGDRLRRVLARLGEREFEERRISAFQERFRWPLGLALACFALRALVGARRPRRPDAARATAVATLALGLFAPLPAAAGVLRPDGADLAGRGRTHYAEGRYAEALADFEAARAANPDDPRLALAAGEALHRLGRHEEAAREFERAVSLTRDPSLRAEGLYNAGTNALASGDVEAAASLLRRSLRLEPGREDALTNLELALRRTQQQPQEGQPQPQQDQQKQDQQQQGQQQQDQQQQGQQQQDQQQQGASPQQDREPQGQPPPEPGQSDAPAAEPPAGQETSPAPGEDLDRERALQILQALDRDEDDFRRAVQHRLRGGENKSGKTW